MRTRVPAIRRQVRALLRRDLCGRIAPAALAVTVYRGHAEPIATSTRQALGGKCGSSADSGMGPTRRGCRLAALVDYITLRPDYRIPGEVNFTVVVSGRGA